MLVAERTELHLLAERTLVVAEPLVGLLLALRPVLLAPHTLAEARLLVLAELRNLVAALPVLPLVLLALEVQGLDPEQRNQLAQVGPESRQTVRERSECRQHTPNH